MPASRRGAALLVVLAVLAGSAGAQVERSGGGANPQLAAQYQAALNEKTQLAADNARLKKDADDAKKELAALKQRNAMLQAGSGSSRAALAAAQASSQDASKNLEQTRSKLQELLGRFRETVATMSGVETERARLQRELTQTHAALDTCADRNFELYKVDNEILDRYAHQGAFGALTRAEPFTRIERTRIDNLALEYRQRAEELRVPRPTATPAATPIPIPPPPPEVVAPPATAVAPPATPPAAAH